MRLIAYGARSGISGGDGVLGFFEPEAPVPCRLTCLEIDSLHFLLGFHPLFSPTAFLPPRILGPDILAGLGTQTNVLFQVRILMA